MESSPAIMVRLPEVFGGKEARKLRREIKQKMGNGMASVIVDMSRVKKLDHAGLDALLECMEEVASRDGAIELGAISPEAAVILELTRMAQLLQRFPVGQAQAPSTVLVPERRAEEEPVSSAVQAPLVA